MSEPKKNYFKDTKQGIGKRKPQEHGSLQISFFSFQHQIFQLSLRIISQFSIFTQYFDIICFAKDISLCAKIITLINPEKKSVN
jgi:hypothetical protein